MSWKYRAEGQETWMTLFFDGNLDAGAAKKRMQDLFAKYNMQGKYELANEAVGYFGFVEPPPPPPPELTPVQKLVAMNKAAVAALVQHALPIVPFTAPTK